jgi:hypothetical protein
MTNVTLDLGTNSIVFFYSLFPIPYSLFPIPYSLFPIPYSLFPIPYSLESNLLKVIARIESPGSADFFI